MSKRNLTRMAGWLAWSLATYAACIVLRTYDLEPQLQTVLWKLGNVSIAAHSGYWIDRHAFQTRITTSSTPHECLRRAIVMGATMLAVGLGL